MQSPWAVDRGDQSQDTPSYRVEFPIIADKAVLWIMIAGLIARVVAPQFYPAGYFVCLHLSATCWPVGFAILLWRYLPFLLTPRVDGRPG